MSKVICYLLCVLCWTVKDFFLWLVREKKNTTLALSNSALTTDLITPYPI